METRNPDNGTCYKKPYWLARLTLHEPSYRDPSTYTYVESANITDVDKTRDQFEAEIARLVKLGFRLLVITEVENNDQALSYGLQKDLTT